MLYTYVLLFGWFLKYPIYLAIFDPFVLQQALFSTSIIWHVYILYFYMFLLVIDGEVVFACLGTYRCPCLSVDVSC